VLEQAATAIPDVAADEVVAAMLAVGGRRSRICARRRQRRTLDP